MYPPNLNVPLPDPSPLAPQQTLQPPDKMQQALSLIAPLFALGTSLGGSPHAGAAFLHGAHQTLQRQDQERQIKAHQDAMLQQQRAQSDAINAYRMEEEARRRAEDVQKFVVGTQESLKGITNKDQWEQQLAFAENIGQQFYGLQPGKLRGIVRYFAPDSKQKVADTLKAFVANPINKGALESGQGLPSFSIDTDGDGINDKPLSFQEAADYVKDVYPISLVNGKIVPVPKNTPTDKFDQAMKIETDIFTADKGHPPQTPQEEGLVYDKANKRAKTPTEPDGSGGAAAKPVVILKPGQQGFKVAQDLAYGRLPFSGFRTIMAYSRDQGAKQAIYDTAASLNPNFNPASFEMGLTLAKNPKVQQQLSSLDNVVQGVPDLLKFSDAASRSGATAINKYTNPVKIAIGDKRFSNLNTARIAFADELSGALGYGSATDMSREMGFNLTDPNLSPDNFKSAIQTVILPFVERKRKAMLDQMGVYGQPGMNPAADKAAQSGFSVKAPNGKTYTFSSQEQLDAFKKAAGIR